MTEHRSTDEIHDDIARAYTAVGPLDHAALARLWREIAVAGSEEGAPSWAYLAAKLVASDHEARAERRP